MQSKITENQNQNSQIENNENQNTQVKEEQNNMEFLKAQEELTVIDIPDQVEKDKEAEEAEKSKKDLKREKHKHNIFYQFTFGRVYTTALISYALIVICNIVYSFIDSALFGENETNTNQAMIEDDLIVVDLYDVISICVIAPILEEFIFRSLIFKVINWCGKGIQEKKKFLGIIVRILAFIISSALFAYGHFGFSFELLIDEIRSFPVYFIAGLLLAYAYNRDGYILASILTHMLNNVVSILLIIYVYNESSDSNFEMIGFSYIKGFFSNIYLKY